MTENVNIKRGDLHLAVSAALSRGRYVLMTGGGGELREITLDLAERDDDLLGAETFEFSGVTPPEQARRLSERFWRERQPHDDHGPTIPAQGWTDTPPEVSYASPFVSGPRVYEFALQDAVPYGFGMPDTLETVVRLNAPDLAPYDAADWVHVYDRVTRERRTLKRPEPDRILTGLRDVAADLRKTQWAPGDWARCIVARGAQREGDLVRVTCVDHAGRFLGFTGNGATQRMDRFEKYQGALTGEPQRGDPVEPPFGCAPMPAVGPLTSTEGLRAGDVLRVIKPVQFGGKEMAVGNIVTAHRIEAGDIYTGTTPDGWRWNRFAFVGRPDVDGWMAWAGGDNPVPGVTVEARTFSKGDFVGKSGGMNWDTGKSGYQIVAFRIVDANQQKEDPS